MSRASKRVSFDLSRSSPQPSVSSPTQPNLTSPLASTTTQPFTTTQNKDDSHHSLSPAPDLVADIINRPKTSHPSKICSQKTESPVNIGNRGSSLISPSEPRSELSQISKKTAIPTCVRLAHPRADSSMHMRDRSASLKQITTAGVASNIRKETNTATHQYVQSIKHDVSQLREHLLKVEEEIKNLNRGRSTLELSVQGIRKALSVNQQSISTQQKKSSRREEDASIKMLREESLELSKGKRTIEQHLQVVKTHLQVLDTTRRNLKTTITTFSSSLGLDAQNFKVYDGPKTVRSGHMSRQRHYASGYQSKSHREEAGKLCSVASDVVSSSKAIRAESKSIVVSVETSKAEAHKKITDAISRNIQMVKAKKRDMLLERGQMRMAQNSTLHRLHEEEIALGIVMGPVSDKYRSVSEKVERPLSHMRPGSAAEEQENTRQTKQKLTRQLSASGEHASHMTSTDKRLSHQLREGSQTVFLDSQTLRVRKMSLDNRWVQ